MKKIFLFIITFILVFTTFGCSKDNNVGTELNPKEETPLEDNEKTFEFINIDIDDLYFVGEESDITISIYPERKIDSISYKSNNEEIITIDNSGHLKALKEGKVLITITIDGKEEKRIIEVDEDELVSALNEYQVTQQEYDELWSRILAREEEAKEHGFSSYKEYWEYLEEQKIKTMEEKQEATRRIAESLGLTFEDYICLQEFKMTYNVAQESCNNIGWSISLDDSIISKYGWTICTSLIDREKNMRLKIAAMYLDETLGYCHSEYEIRCSAYFSPKKNSDGTYDYSYGSHYMSIIVFNNFGYEVDSSIFSKIEEEMPKVNYYVNLYDYLKTKVDYETAYAYVRELVCPLYDAKLDDDVVKSIEEYIKEYEK